MILPLRIDGAQYTPFSRLKGKFRRRWFPKITLTLLPPRKLAVDTALRGRARRQAIGLELYDLMTDMVFATTNYRRTLFEALLEARHIYGGQQPIVEDIRRQPLSYNRLLAGSFALGARAHRALGAGGAGGPATAQFGRCGHRLLRPHRHGAGAGPAQLQHRPRRHEIGLPRCGDQDHRDGAGLLDGGQAGGRRGGSRQGYPHPRSGGSRPGNRPGEEACGLGPRPPAEVLPAAGHRPRGSRGGAVHLRLGGHAQGRGAEPRQYPGQSLSDGRAARFQPARCGVQRAADLPFLRPYRRAAAAAPGGGEDLPLPLAAALPPRAAARL